jgi:O-methyltransferase
MLPRDVQEAARLAGVPAAGTAATPAWPSGEEEEAAAEWLATPAAARLPAVRRYLFYLKWMYETFQAVAECFPRSGEAAAPDGMGTSGEEMLYLANHLYVLASHGVPGAVLECGCFKGYSSACLSHACATLGRQLVVADSFQGLPVPGPGEEGYRPGEFQGTLAEVRENVRTFGRPEHVRFREGWFRDSLRGWSEPLALLWLDVDLYESAADALAGAFPALDPRGAVFSHEFLPDRIRDGEIVHAAEPPGALRDFLAARGIAYRARHLCGWTAMVALPGSLGLGSDRLLAALLPHLRDADHRARAARRAIGLRPALRDLGRRLRTRALGSR